MIPTPNYRKLETEAYALRLTALRMEQAAQKGDGEATFITYCEIIIHHEKIRDIVAGRER